MGATSRTVARLQPFSTTIFADMSALAAQHDAINLGQGFPDTDGPESMLRAACEAITSGQNQYPPGPGIAPLRQAVAAQQRRRYGLDYDTQNEVLVTVGATEAITAGVLGLVEPGEEVVLIEPYYDSYAAAVAMAGAVRRSVPLVPRGDGIALDREALAAAVTDDTAMIIVNTPHNPTGTVLTDDDLSAIAAECLDHDVIALADEVYEYLTFDGAKHRPLASWPGMGDRTLRVSSAAKTFNATGWKVGWVSGPPRLIAAARAAKQFLTFVGSGPFQPAVAAALETEEGWVTESVNSLQRKRDLLSDALRDVGFDVWHSSGTYFVCADPRPLGFHDGADLCRELPKHVGVAAIPVSAFIDPDLQRHADDPWLSMVRFAFAKQDEVIEEAARRLRGLS